MEEGDDPVIDGIRGGEIKEFMRKRKMCNSVKGFGEVKIYEGYMLNGGKESGCMVKDGDNMRGGRASGAESKLVNWADRERLVGGWKLESRLDIL